MTNPTPQPISALATFTGADTDTDTGLSLERIAEATDAIDPVFLNSPQYVDEHLSAILGRDVLVKVETLNPLRSFKGRGADTLMHTMPPGAVVVCASGGGNFGQAIGYAARRRGLQAHVFVPPSMSAIKLNRMEGFGARLHVVDDDLHAASATFAAEGDSRILITDGNQPAIAEGAGTIGVELLQAATRFDTVALPVGDGALITGVARWLKAHAPQIRVIGVGAADAPAMMRSWRTGDVVTTAPRSTFAAGISITRPHPEAVRRCRALVDDMLLVDRDDLVHAMHIVRETLGVLAEPAGVAGIAALARHDVPGGTAATVITGANADPDHLAA
ncbi:threonine ammonia-lyase [Phytoactinopolyspora mesophila]|uniref:Pyridoxal-phosphate dependent enzyme n=1 Tax=Phytoactinopolyspora mesophila TaxID=2650750 RepID=A0A7K3M1A4_9ACTN|nr:threonine/serine dehydratase [Phytoactinopolyspora mesophila]NDL57085.1 pyridoxal-phosphate dependent enzyme [Phytoactinopolyspora mesophila]